MATASTLPVDPIDSNHLCCAPYRDGQKTHRVVTERVMMGRTRSAEREISSASLYGMRLCLCSEWC